MPCARLHARQVLWEWGLDAITETAELLVSELLTNGVKAAEATDHKPPVQLRMSGNGACVLIEIWDGNTQPPVPRELENDVSALEAEGGRGLFLVETLSERWGRAPHQESRGQGDLVRNMPGMRIGGRDMHVMRKSGRWLPVRIDDFEEWQAGLLEESARRRGAVLGFPPSLPLGLSGRRLRSGASGVVAGEPVP